MMRYPINKCRLETLLRQCGGVHQGQHGSFQARRDISTDTALQVLGLDKGTVHSITPKQLRSAYLAAAKKSHPDMSMQPNHREMSSSASSVTTRVDAAKQFRLVIEAYECLQQKQLNYKHNEQRDDVDYGITDREEQAFRRACQEWLGLSAEVVEESKQCPSFRQWLQGRTDAAFYWRMFFVQNGGLAPMLRRSSTIVGHLPVRSPTRRPRRPAQR